MAEVVELPFPKRWPGLFSIEKMIQPSGITRPQYCRIFSTYSDFSQAARSRQFVDFTAVSNFDEPQAYQLPRWMIVTTNK